MKKRKKITTILITLSVLVGVLILFNSFRGEVSKSSNLDKEIKRLQEEAERLKNRNNILINLTEELDDLEFLENEARVKMGLKMPGEEVVVINRVTSTAYTTEKSASTGLRRDKQPVRQSLNEGGSVWENPRRWWEYFFEVKK